MCAHLPVAHEALHVLDSVASPSRLDTRFQLHVQAAPSACCTCFHSYSPCTPTWASALLTPTPAVGAGGAASITPIWASAPLTPMPPVGAGGVALHHPHLGLSSSDTDARCRGLGGRPPSHSHLFPCLYLLLGLSSVRTRGLVCLVGLWP